MAGERRPRERGVRRINFFGFLRDCLGGKREPARRDRRAAVMRIRATAEPLEGRLMLSAADGQPVLAADSANTIGVTLPAAGWEGQTLAGGGTVSIGAALADPLTVTLLSSDASALSVPASVTIPAGQLFATFDVSLIQDGVNTGDRTAMLTASADGEADGSASIGVQDSTLDHLAFGTITGPETVDVAFPITIQAFNIDDEVISVFNGTASLGATGDAGSLPVSLATGNFVSGVFSGNISIGAVDPSVTIDASSGGISGASDLFEVEAGPVAGFQFGAIGSPQYAGVPFGSTVTAQDANGFTADYNGSLDLSGLIGVKTAQTLLGSPSFTFAGRYEPATFGYAFTPNTDITVTAVRSYFGRKVSIWTDTGVLLASQTVDGSPQAWTDTSLNTPLHLTAGVTYRISVYDNGNFDYWRNVAPANPSFASIGQTYEASGDVFPTFADAQWWLVDLRADVGSIINIPITPTSANFVDGIWSGNVTVAQLATGMILSAENGAGITGVSGSFDILQSALSVSVPSDATEGDGTVAGTLSINAAPSADLTVNLLSSDPSRMTVPSTILIPAGQTSVPLPLTVIDDDLLNGPEPVTVTASMSDATPGSGTITIHDNETATLSMSLPTSIVEGSFVNVTVTASAAPTRDITLQLVSSNTSLLTVDPTAVIFAGTTTAVFSVAAPDNLVTEGNQPATVTVSFESWTGCSSATTVIDIDHVIRVSLTPSAFEGQGVVVTLSFGEGLPAPLKVFLESSDPTALSVPQFLTFQGSSQGSFFVDAVDDGLRDGTRIATLTASAVGWVTGTASIAVHDSTLDHFGFGTISGPVTANVFFPIQIQAYNVNNEVIPVFSGTATIGASGQAGTVPISLTTAKFSAGIFNGSLSVNAVDPNVTLTAASGGSSGTSNPFLTQAGQFTGFQWSAITGKSVNTPFAATLTAVDANGYPTTEFNGAVNLTGPAPGNGGALLNVPITPATATLVNGVWTGSVTVLQTANGMHLHADDGAGHLADSSTFNVVPSSSAAPALIVNNGAAQRSIVMALTVTFADPVTLANGAITLATMGGTSVGFNLAMQDAKDYTLTFPFGGRSMADGQYVVTVHAAGVTDTVGSGIASDVQFGFYKLYGDFLGTGLVSFEDLVMVVQAFNARVGSSQYQSFMDIDGGGTIDFSDLVGVVQNFNKVQSAPVFSSSANNSANTIESDTVAIKPASVVVSPAVTANGDGLPNLGPGSDVDDQVLGDSDSGTKILTAGGSGLFPAE